MLVIFQNPEASFDGVVRGSGMADNRPDVR